MSSSPLPSNSPSSSAVTLRRLVAADVPVAMELKNLAGWNQTARDWLGYLEYEPEGCFAAEWAGRTVGTATTIRHEGRVGWIGMVLVHPDARRAGIGTKLLRQSIDYLRGTGTPCIKLDATPMGRKVYVPLGFQDEYELSRFTGVAPAVAPESGHDVRPLAAADLAAVTAFDAPRFGAERGVVLRSMAQRNPAMCWVAWTPAGVGGYLLGREGHGPVQLGPWVAREAGIAEALLRRFLAVIPGRTFYVDVPHPNAAGCALVKKYGLTVQRGYARMFLGENRHPGDPASVFGTSGAEKG